MALRIPSLWVGRGDGPATALHCPVGDCVNWMLMVGLTGRMCVGVSPLLTSSHASSLSLEEMPAARVRVFVLARCGRARGVNLPGALPACLLREEAAEPHVAMP